MLQGKSVKFKRWANENDCKLGKFVMFFGQPCNCSQNVYRNQNDAFGGI